MKNLIVICAWCQRIHWDGRWQHILGHAERMISEGWMPTHGICPCCASELEGGAR